MLLYFISFHKLASLLDGNFFSGKERDNQILPLIEDDVNELDDFRGHEYTDEKFYKDLCEIVRAEECFHEISSFLEVTSYIFYCFHIKL